MLDRGNLCQEISTLCMDFSQANFGNLKKLAELTGGLTFFVTAGAAQTAEEPKSPRSVRAV